MPLSAAVSLYVDAVDTSTSLRFQRYVSRYGPGWVIVPGVMVGTRNPAAFFVTVAKPKLPVRMPAVGTMPADVTVSGIEVDEITLSRTVMVLPRSAACSV